jgi:hypothetical protein
MVCALAKHYEKVHANSDVVGSSPPIPNLLEHVNPHSSRAGSSVGRASVYYRKVLVSTPNQSILFRGSTQSFLGGLVYHSFSPVALIFSYFNWPWISLTGTSIVWNKAASGWHVRRLLMSSYIFEAFKYACVELIKQLTRTLSLSLNVVTLFCIEANNTCL